MASIDLYTKQQIDAKIPSTSGASSGDVLTFNGSATVWAAPGGGGASLEDDTIWQMILASIKSAPSNASSENYKIQIWDMVKDATTNDTSISIGTTKTIGGKTVVFNSYQITQYNISTIAGSSKLKLMSVKLNVTINSTTYDNTTTASLVQSVWDYWD